MAENQTQRKRKKAPSIEDQYLRYLNRLPVSKEITTFLKDNELWPDKEGQYAMEVLHQVDIDRVTLVGYDKDQLLGLVLLDSSMLKKLIYELMLALETMARGKSNDA